MTEQPAKRARVETSEPWPPVDANEAIHIHFIKLVKEFPSRIEEVSAEARQDAWPPEFTHQIFDDEQIHGYTGLHIHLFFTTDHYVPLLLSSYEGKRFPAADYVRALRTHFTWDLPTELKSASAKQLELPSLADVLEGDSSVKVVGRCSMKDGHDVGVYQVVLSHAGKAVKALHARLHPLLLLYVDAASPLEQTDDRMTLLLAARLVDSRPTEVLGFLTYFRLYHFPYRERWRVAQILVMPPFQRLGVGRALLETVNQLALTDARCADISYEDAADALQTLRERIDAPRAAALPAVDSAAAAAARRGLAELRRVRGLSGDRDGGDLAAAVEALRCPPPAAEVMREALKLCVHQVERVWDSLVFAAARAYAGAAVEEAETLVEQRVMARELEEAGELSPRPISTGGDVPSNKIVMDTEDLQLAGMNSRVAALGGSGSDAACSDGDEDGTGSADGGASADADGIGNVGACGERAKSTGGVADGTRCVRGGADNTGVAASNADTLATAAGEAGAQNPQMTFLMLRKDICLGINSRHGRRGCVTGSTVPESRRVQVVLADLNEEARTSMKELVSERLDAVVAVSADIPWACEHNQGRS